MPKANETAMLKRLMAIAEECKAELGAIDIPYSKGAMFVINYRAKRRWGYCKRVDGLYRIEIASRLLEDGVDPAGAKNTVIHELLHTCPSSIRHTGAWLRYANKVNAAYGYDIKRTATSDEKGVEEAPDADFRYILACTGCGKTWRYHKLTKAVRNYRNCKCSVCAAPIKLVQGPEPSAVEKAPLYQFECKGCGAIARYYRATKFTKNPAAYHCTRCGGKFKRVI